MSIYPTQWHSQFVPLKGTPNLLQSKIWPICSPQRHAQSVSVKDAPNLSHSNTRPSVPQSDQAQSDHTYSFLWAAHVNIIIHSLDTYLPQRGKIHWGSCWGSWWLFPSSLWVMDLFLDSYPAHIWCPLAQKDLNIQGENLCHDQSIHWFKQWPAEWEKPKSQLWSKNLLI